MTTVTVLPDATIWPGVDEITVDYSIDIPAGQISGKSVIYVPHPHHFQYGMGHVQLWAWDAQIEGWAERLTVERERIANHPTGRTLVESYGEGPEYGGETPVGCPTDWCNTVVFGETTDVDIRLTWREIVIPALPPEPIFLQTQYAKWSAIPFQYPLIDGAPLLSASPTFEVRLPELPSPYVWEVWRKRSKKHTQGKFKGKATGTIPMPENYGGHDITWPNKLGAYALFARLADGATAWEVPAIKHHPYRWRVYNPATGGRTVLTNTGIVRRSTEIRVVIGR